MGPIEPTSNIARERAAHGLTQRQLASKLRLTLREMKAVERGEIPAPLMEKITYSSKYVEFLGYAIQLQHHWPVQHWDAEKVKAAESRALAVLDELPCPPRDHRTRKNIARERIRLERAKRKKNDAK